jgi:hypothetical protein
MLGVVGQEPVGAAIHGRQEHWNIGGMANQMAIGAHAINFPIGHPFRATQRNQAAIVFDELIGVCGTESACVE